MTLSFAVIISSFVALSLSPMIASKVLVKKNIKSKVSQKFEVSLNKFRDFYKRTLLFWLKRKKEIIIFLITILVLTTSVFLYAPKELMPKEDRGAFFVIIKAPESSGFEYTSSKSEEIEGFLLPEVGKGEYRRLLLRVPGFGKSSTQVNSGFIIVLLEHWDNRKRDGQE